MAANMAFERPSRGKRCADSPGFARGAAATFVHRRRRGAESNADRGAAESVHVLETRKTPRRLLHSRSARAHRPGRPTADMERMTTRACSCLIIVIGRVPD